MMRVGLHFMTNVSFGLHKTRSAAPHGNKAIA